jgi:gas vesicle protein
MEFIGCPGPMGQQHPPASRFTPVAIIDGAAFFLMGAAIGAAAPLMAPASGAHTRRRLRRKGEEVADYLIDAGKELVDKCEDLYERSEEVVEDVTHELSGKYRALQEYSRQLLDEVETILRRTKSAAIGR